MQKEEEIMASNNQIPVQLQPGTPENDKIAYINQNFRSLADAFAPLIINDGSNNRIMIGKLPDGTYGIVVTAPGYDVEDVVS